MIRVRLFPLLFFFVAFTTIAEAKVDVRAVTEAKMISQLPRKSLYAIGLVENTYDPITILNGRLYVVQAEMKPGAKKPSLWISNLLKTRTTNLTYANVNIWSEAPLKGESRTRANLGPLLDLILKETGYQLAGQFPFLIKGKFTSVSLYYGPPDKPMKLSEKQISGIVVGFLTKKFVEKDGKEIPEFAMGMHFVDDSGKIVGAVEDFKIEAKNKVVLFMPK